ncbi:YueI family protein [Vagococcus carniphilus]|uniref:DUF1694 domain-containing protein n=1 Tax=Vagococcus carniphilus TaxID=218144 RepID=A0A430B3H6_9ENTE|nr:YueI family protein [Vagococcus carniphilus]QNN73404.1 YueI family protein [Vagococcus carniphilus]RSU14897.1 hypothetical protein CBF28_07445 [Vagococcus carniphilus]
MAKKDIQDYLDKGMYGTPKIKPDEQKKYLGTYRERVVFIMTFDEAKQNAYDAFCLEKFANHPDGTLLIDANSSMTIQNHFMKLTQQKKIDFRLVDSDAERLKGDDIAMVFTLSKPIDLEDISVKEKLSKKITTTPNVQKEKKSGFFKKIFS